MSLWSLLKNKIAKRYEDWDDWDEEGWDYLNNPLEEGESDSDADEGYKPKVTHEYDNESELSEETPVAKTKTKQIRKTVNKDWEGTVYTREHVDIHDRQQRHDYVTGCLDQIEEAGREIDSLNYEYNMVTSYLKDMEEIEALPLQEKAALETAAARVSSIRKEKAMTDGEKLKLADAKYRKFNAMDGDVEEGIEKLQETEIYQKKIKNDLKTLDNERQAYKIRRGELLGTLEDCQGMAVVCSVAVAVCIIALLFLQFGMGMNASWGYIIAGGGAAIFYTMLFLKYREAKGEYKRTMADINKLILLQNKVKIRYVNNTNLLDYLCMKYKVDSSKELIKLWNQYKEEKARRDAYRKAQIALDSTENELLHILRRCQIADPAIWLNQTDALLDHKEMVEIRHSLIVRRQSLRKRMDYNREVIAAKAQNEIRALVESYPRYASEIMELVEEYDKKNSVG